MVRHFRVFALLLLLANCLNFSANDTNAPLKSKKSAKSKSRTLIPLVLVNATSYGAKIDGKLGENCRFLKGYKHQRNECKKRRGMLNLLRSARQLVISNCAHQFRRDRWNCVMSPETFSNTTRETAYIQSLTSAALSYVVAQGCTEDRLENCSCSKESKQPKRWYSWKWSGCGDNVRDGKAIATRFLKLKGRALDDEDALYQINGRIGLKSVARNAMKTCICHGVSGSCTMRICVRRLSQFERVAEELKHKYHNALLATSVKESRERLARLRQTGRLLYAAPSPNFCELTVRRRCFDPVHCATYCCGRGKDQRRDRVERKCNFRMANSVAVSYDTCYDYEDVYTCK